MNVKNLVLLILLIFSQALFAGDIFLYISLRTDNKVAIYKVDTGNGSLQLVEKFTVTGGPASIAIDGAKKHLYVGQRSAKTISSFIIDPKTGKLSLLNTIAAVDDPVYLSVDKTNRFLLSAYYNASKAAIYPLNDDASVGATSIRTVNTGTNAHAILTEPSNRFVYIPNKTGEKIQHYPFNAATGDITISSLAEYVTTAPTGPRHLVFHSVLPLVYFSNELGSSASVYAINQNTGALTHLQTLSTLPSTFTGTNTVADIHITKNDRFLYLSNRGHNSIAAFSLDPNTGLMKTIGQYATVNTPRAFCVDPTDHFLYAAGEASANLATYRIDPASGALSQLGTNLNIGNSPFWVMPVEILSTVTGLPSENVSNSLQLAFAPNPLTASSNFSFQLASAQKVNITLFNSLGNPVKVIVDSMLESNKHSFAWDGTDNANRKLPAGAYTALLRTTFSTESFKVIVP